MTIGQRIFELLEQRGMTQKEFSERTNIGQSTICDWKRKGTNPGADKIMIISEVLGVSCEDILSGGDVISGKGRKPDNYIIDRNSELGMVVKAYSDMDEAMRARMLGYYEAMTSKFMEKKKAEE